MRVAALYDIHANLPALDAVLEQVQNSAVDRVVIGGDALLGPKPRETLDRLLALEVPVDFIYGNCDRAMLAQMAAPDAGSATYWGTASGNPIPEPHRSRMRWAAEQIRDHEALLASWPRTARLAIDGLGEVVFCHSTPRSETEIFTRLTDEARLVPIFDTLDASVVVCGHTHMQFDRMIGRTRVVNAGSVGMPIGQRGAFWLLLGPGVELQRTSYELVRATDLIRATAYPDAEDWARTLLQPPAEAATLEAYGKAELT
jgi:predicted phosphodiesterase